jgi:predicted transposase/invertase (TIGR01784 family)
LLAVLRFPDGEFDIVFIDPHLKREFEDDKLCILDIRVSATNGKEIEVELQVARTANIFERICYYKAEMLVGQLKKGDWYDKVKKTISITITDFNFIEGGDPGRYHHCFRPHDPVDGTYFGDVEEAPQALSALLLVREGRRHRQFLPCLHFEKCVVS